MSSQSLHFDRHCHEALHAVGTNRIYISCDTRNLLAPLRISPRCKCEPRLPESLAMFGWPFRLFTSDMPLRGIQGLRGFSDCRCRHGLLLLLLLTLLLRLRWATGGAAITTSASLLSRMPRAERVFTQFSPDCFEFLNPLCTSVFAKSSVFYSKQQYSVYVTYLFGGLKVCIKRQLNNGVMTVIAAGRGTSLRFILRL